MSKEQCVICVDNSEFTRNGDYIPTRFESEIDAVNMILSRKIESHPENTVAIMSMAGHSPAVRVALSTDFGKLLSAVASVEIEGDLRLSESLKVAKLALKRFSGDGTPNRRIVSFVGSPLKETKEELSKLGAELKKSNIAIDVVNFGEVVANQEKLEALIAGANKDDNCHIVTVPPGHLMLVDAIMTSPIFLGAAAGGAAGAEGGAAGAAGFEFGVDPSLDPELALALRLSMEEERRNQERRAREAGEGAAGAGAAAAAPASGAAPAAAQAQPAAADLGADVMMDEDEALRMALEMSRQEAGLAGSSVAPAPSTTSTTSTAGGTTTGADDMIDDEDEELRMALEMSKREAEQTSSAAASSAQPQQQQQTQDNIQDLLKDEAFLNDVIGSLPGVKKDDEKKKDGDGSSQQ